MPVIRVAACQVDVVMGDLEGNVDKLVGAFTEAARSGCDLAAAPELAIPGYPPEDLVLKPRFVDDNLAALESLADSTRELGCAFVVGFVDRMGPDASLPAGQGPDGGRTRLTNASAVVYQGRIVNVYAKHLLPNYAVFDEKRYFTPGPLAQSPCLIAGVPVSVLICEDVWAPEPTRAARDEGAQLLVVINSSPYYRGRLQRRISVAAERARETGCPLLYVNLVGGQDELVFDGASFVVSADGSVLQRGAQFREEVIIADIEVATLVLPDSAISVTSEPRDHPLRVPAQIPAPLDPIEEVYEALVLGTRDYIAKNGFSGALVGMSGGIDSSLVAVIAADAIGPERVHGIAMPSRYSSEGSLSDAKEVAANLGIDFRVIPIEPAHRAFREMLAAGEEMSLAEENLQSRIRGVTIMYLSNANGWIVLTTGNKSELAVGYSTLYGDTAGGFAVIKDVPKTLVYELARWRNRIGEEEPERFVGGQGTKGRVVPDSVLDKPPSAELRPEQRDDQSLPPYDVLDPVLESYVERDATVADLLTQGFDPDLAASVARLVDLAEYKRRQNPPGVRVTPKAFGKDRRMPITNRYSGHDAY